MQRGMAGERHLLSGVTGLGLALAWLVRGPAAPITKQKVTYA